MSTCTLWLKHAALKECTTEIKDGILKELTSDVGLIVD